MNNGAPKEARQNGWWWDSRLATGQPRPSGAELLWSHFPGVPPQANQQPTPRGMRVNLRTNDRPFSCRIEVAPRFAALPWDVAPAIPTPAGVRVPAPGAHLTRQHGRMTRPCLQEREKSLKLTRNPSGATRIRSRYSVPFIRVFNLSPRLSPPGAKLTGSRNLDPAEEKTIRRIRVTAAPRTASAARRAIGR